MSLKRGPASDLHSTARGAVRRRISNREYQTLFGVSRRTASNDLGELTTHGLLAVEGAGRTTRYRLADSDT